MQSSTFSAQRHSASQRAVRVRYPLLRQTRVRPLHEVCCGRRSPFLSPSRELTGPVPGDIWGNVKPCTEPDAGSLRAAPAQGCSQATNRKCLVLAILFACTFHLLVVCAGLSTMFWKCRFDTADTDNVPVLHSRTQIPGGYNTSDILTRLVRHMLTPHISQYVLVQSSLSVKRAIL